MCFWDLLYVVGFSYYFFPALPCLCLMSSLVRRMEFGFVLADYAFAGGGDVYEWYSSMFFQEANSSCCSTGRLCVLDFLNIAMTRSTGACVRGRVFGKASSNAN